MVVRLFGALLRSLVYNYGIDDEAKKQLREAAGDRVELDEAQDDDDEDGF